MAREIKCRAWDKKNKEMLSYKKIMLSWGCGEGALWVTTTDNLITRSGIDFDVQQYTGRNDFDNEPIYEGDYVKDKLLNLYEVKYFDSKAAFVLLEYGTKNYTMFEKFNYQQTNFAITSLKIVGNIHENPGLLDKNEQVEDR